MKKNLILLFVVAIVLQTSLSFGAETNGFKRIKNHRNRFVKLLEQQYDKYLKASTQGDAEAYKQIMTNETVSRMEEYIKMQKLANDLSSFLKDFAKNNPDYRQFKFAFCDQGEQLSRVAYQRLGTENPATKKKPLEFFVMFFQFENNEWKMSYNVQSWIPETNEDGSKASVEQVLK